MVSRYLADGAGWRRWRTEASEEPVLVGGKLNLYTDESESPGQGFSFPIPESHLLPKRFSRDSDAINAPLSCSLIDRHVGSDR